MIYSGIMNFSLSLTIMNQYLGWENYLSKEKVKIRKVVSNDERLFSLSSVTSPASRNEERKKSANLSGKKTSRKATSRKKTKEGNPISDSPSQPANGEIVQSTYVEEEEVEDLCDT